MEEGEIHRCTGVVVVVVGTCTHRVDGKSEEEGEETGTCREDGKLEEEEEETYTCKPEA